MSALGARYLDALAQAEDPTPPIGALDALSSGAATGDGRAVRPFDPLAGQQRTLFEVMLCGEHTLHGCDNCELCHHQVRVVSPLAAEVAKPLGQVSRLLRRLHIHRWIARIRRSRRWRAARNARRMMAAAVKLPEAACPSLYAEAV